jgi:predicted nucleic acid-binding Zn ribbon protein
LVRGGNESIGTILDTLAARMGIKKQIKKANVLNDWAEIVGPKIAAETRAEHVRGVILFVNCSNPVWAQQLELLKPEIMKKVRAAVGPGIIMDIRFRTGQI